jgi:hypothetical protein
MDMIDFLVGQLEEVSGVAINTGGTYRTEDVTVAAFRAGADVAGSGVWNFNAVTGPPIRPALSARAEPLRSRCFLTGTWLCQMAAGSRCAIPRMCTSP